MVSTHRRDSFLLGAAIGIIGMTFGVLAVTAGLSVGKAIFMSLFVFTGASQFAAVGVIGAGGSPLTAVGGALLLAARNGLYGIRMSSTLDRSRAQQLLGAQLVIDESTAMATAQHDEVAGREAFWITGLSVFVFWNLGTVVGALVGSVVGDPKVYGLDAAFLASFVALIGPHIRERPGQVAAFGGALIAIVAVPLTPAGAPILFAAIAVLPALALARRQDSPERPQ